MIFQTINLLLKYTYYFLNCFHKIAPLALYRNTLYSFMGNLALSELYSKQDGSLKGYAFNRSGNQQHQCYKERCLPEILLLPKPARWRTLYLLLYIYVLLFIFKKKDFCYIYFKYFLYIFFNLYVFAFNFVSLTSFISSHIFENVLGKLLDIFADFQFSQSDFRPPFRWTR